MPLPGQPPAGSCGAGGARLARARPRRPRAPQCGRLKAPAGASPTPWARPPLSGVSLPGGSTLSVEGMRRLQFTERPAARTRGAQEQDESQEHEEGGGAKRGGERGGEEGGQTRGRASPPVGAQSGPRGGQAGNSRQQALWTAGPSGRRAAATLRWQQPVSGGPCLRRRRQESRRPSSGARRAPAGSPPSAP